MLFDRVIVNPEYEALGQGGKHLVADLRAAHRFVLETDFALAADELRTSKPSAFIKAVPLLRLPYPLIWLEVRFQDRKLFVSQGDKLLEGQFENVSRVGVLVKELSPLHWRMDLFWSFQDDRVSGSMVSLEVDLNKAALEPAIPPKVNPAFADLSGADLAAMLTLERIIEPVVSDYYREFAMTITSMPGGTEKFADLSRQAIGDWTAEPNFWLAAIAMLNSRNVVESQAVEPSEKLNKARSKRGAPPLLSYTVCDISRRLRQRIREATSQAGTGVRAHFVRGHFKIRTSGIFWWSPFVRGDRRAGLVLKEYRAI